VASSMTEGVKGCFDNYIFIAADYPFSLSEPASPRKL
jgi:hypothetical protein